MIPDELQMVKLLVIDIQLTTVHRQLHGMDCHNLLHGIELHCHKSNIVEAQVLNQKMWVSPKTHAGSIHVMA